jgi:hypothetical protein
MTHLGGLEEAEMMGLRAKQSVTELSALLVTSTIVFLYTYFQVKVYRYDHLYTAIIKRSSHARAQTLILKYPEAYSALHFRYHLVGNPINMLPKRAVPPVMILLLIILILSLIIMVGFWLWLIYAVSSRLWFDSSGISVFWTRATIVASWLVLVFSMLLSATGSGGRIYNHAGLVNLLTRAQTSRPHRYAYFIQKLAAMRESAE